MCFSEIIFSSIKLKKNLKNLTTNYTENSIRTDEFNQAADEMEVVMREFAAETLAELVKG